MSARQVNAERVTDARTTAPRVTAVVLNWCNEHDTLECLDSLGRQDYSALTILLVDNGSPDGSGARLHARYSSLPFLQTGENLGYAGGNNRGMKHALESGTDYVLVLNNDTVLEPGCVSELVRAAATHGDAGAVGGKILRHDAPDRIWFGGGRFDRLRAIGRHERANRVDIDPAERQPFESTFLTGCCLLIPAATLRTVGYFRDDFFAYLEDAEYGLRIMKSGKRLFLAPAARLRHRVPSPGSSPSPDQIHLRDRNRRRIVRLHYSRLDAIFFAMWFYPTRAALIARYTLRGEVERVRAMLRGMVEV
jgi:GT2 family glycosyltransferase